MAFGPHVADHCPLPAEWVLGRGSSLFRPPPPGMALSGSTPAPSWEEDECLDYYGMLSLHRMFEVVGGQLTECELDLLAFLLDEAPGAAGGLCHTHSGLELLLELERRGQCDESDLRLLGQLLRVLARQDLLPHLARRRRRPGMVEWEDDRLPMGRGSWLCIWAAVVPDMDRVISDSLCPMPLPPSSQRNTRGSSELWEGRTCGIWPCQ